MKSLVLTLAVSILGSTSAFAATDTECSISSDGAAVTQIALMEIGQFATIVNQGRLEVYSCGAFTNDGTVPVDQNTKIFEMKIPSCMTVATTSPHYMFYCHQ